MPDNAYPHLYPLAQAVGDALRKQGASLVTVESCTGGWLGKVITDIPGSSEWYYGGWIVYSNQAKVQWLEVKEATLDVYGAVSRETALELIHGALALTPAAYAISITGIAGPSGGSSDKPVGTVYVGFGKRDESPLVHHFQFPSHYPRETIRQMTVYQTLKVFLALLQNPPSVPFFQEDDA